MMDEPTKTAQDSLPIEGQTSDATSKVTSEKPETQTLTVEEFQKRLSDEKAKMGRELKAAQEQAKAYKASMEKLEQELQSNQQQLAEIQARIDEAEESAARDNPDRLNLLQQRRLLQKEKAELKAEKAKLEKERAELSSEIALAKETKAEITIWNIAKESGVDANELKTRCQKLGLTNVEQIKEMASFMKSIGSNEKRTPIPKADSGQTRGAAIDALKAMYPTHFK